MPRLVKFSPLKKVSILPLPKAAAIIEKIPWQFFFGMNNQESKITALPNAAIR
jgi:hypothetical protein